MSRPLLTIAIPTYNRADLLDLCLGKIVDQLAPHSGLIELIVSNNASTDHTELVVKKYQQHDQLRYYTNEKNGGPDFNIAKCFELATAKYVWVFSDDDYILPGALTHLLKLLSQHDLGIVFLEAAFYRDIPYELPLTNEPLGYELYDDPRQLAAKVNFWLTYISSVVTNKDLLQGKINLHQYQNSFLIQLGWVLPALFSGKPSIRITTVLVLGRTLPVLDFKLFHVFGASYPRVLRSLAERGILPVETKNLLIELIIKEYFPRYIHPSVVYAHGERPLLILSKSFWKQKSFWVTLMPRLIRRSLVLSLNKIKQPLQKTIGGRSQEQTA